MVPHRPILEVRDAMISHVLQVIAVNDLGQFQFVFDFTRRKILVFSGNHIVQYKLSSQRSATAVNVESGHDFFFIRSIENLLDFRS